MGNWSDWRASTVPLLMDVARKWSLPTSLSLQPFITYRVLRFYWKCSKKEMPLRGANAATMLGNLHYKAAIPQHTDFTHLDDDDNVKIEVSTALRVMRITPAVVAPLMEALRENPRIRWR
ncbi:MAG: hypothetical protein U0694_02195 [Anaerolineae bacterium]